MNLVWLLGLWRRVAGGLVLLLVSACGGGGSGSADPLPVNRAPVAQAGVAQNVTAGSLVVLDGSASSDADGDPLSYSWTLSARPSGSVATLSSASAVRPSFTADLEGSYAATLVVSDGKTSSAPASVAITAVVPVPPTIVIDRTEPLSGTVTLSLSRAVAGSVTWFVDLNQVGTGATVTWATGAVSNGAHLLVARIQPPPGIEPYEVRRTVTVSNSSITVSTFVSGTRGIIAVNAVPSSPFGITSVSATFDGTPVGTLTAPNACSSILGCATNNAYRFNVDAAKAKSGNHTMVFAITDGSGASLTTSVAVPISNAPVLNVTTPADGAFVFGTLQVGGTAATDKAGGITVTALLGDLQFLQTAASPFAGTFDLGGLAPGSYVLTVRATDSTNLSTQVQRTVVVTSSANLAYTPVFTMSADAQLLAAEGQKVLVASGDGSVRIRDLVNAAEIDLSGASAIQYASDWQLSGGRVYAFGKGTDCVLYCIYQWTADGARSNLTNPNPYSLAANIGGGWAYDLHPVARDGYVVWVNDKAADTGVATSATGRYTVLHLASGTYTRVGVPAGVNYMGNWNYDFAVVGGVVHFYYWAQTGGEGTNSTFDVFKWRSDTGVSTKLTAGGGRSIYVQTDGVSAAWQQTPLGGTADAAFALVNQPLAGGISVTSAAQATSFRLRDGVLAWVETGPGGARAIKASSLAATATLSSLSTASLLANGGGRVAFAQQGRVYVFQMSSGMTTTRVEAVPTGPVFLAGGALVFAMRSSVYRVQLD